jgi:putative FmdB family regulatory protein
MPIVRTYQCGDCFHRIEVMLDGSRWDEPPPDCPACAARQMDQQFKPPAIGGSNRAKAIALAETIASEDYGVADMKLDKEGPNKVRYKDEGTPAQASTWGVGSEILTSAMRIGRQTRQQYGDGLDVLKSALKSGAQPDLIEMSKKRAARIW